MISNLTTTAAGLAGAYIFLWALLRFTQDAREPPTVENLFPFLSPILGMISKGSNFHKYLRSKYNLPICTLRLPGSRLYIINDTSLIPILQRQVSTLSISPIMVRVFSHFMGITGDGLSIMGQDPIGAHGFVHQITTETSKALKPGPNLDDLNSKAVQILNRSLEALAFKQGSTTVDLFEWASLEIMLATTNAVYGSQNPFKIPRVREAYYDYEAGLITLMTGFLPSVLARRSLRGRDVLIEAFEKYYQEGGLENSSVYARNRYEFPSQQGVSVRDVAKMESGGAIGLISNTMPATFWMLYHVLSDPVALEDCRQEVSKALSEKNGEIYLDLAFIKSSCPILTSTMQEAFRFHSIGIAARAVVEDHMLGGQYLLKKGNTILIPSTVQHSSSLAWGDDFNEFHYKRFVKDPKKTKKHDPVAFRAFGGGATLCPGRHFASTEILAFASVILLRFDVKPVDGWGVMAYKEMNAAFRLPNKDISVELVPRDNKKWNVFFSEPGKAMEISHEDIARSAEHLQ